MPVFSSPVNRRRCCFADHAPGEASEDWGEGRQAREVRLVPVGRGRRTPPAIRRDPRSDRTAG